MEQVKYKFDLAFQARIAAFLVQDPVFLPAHRDVIKPSYFETSDMSIIVGLVTRYFDDHKLIPDQVSLLNEVKVYCLSARMGEAQGQAIRVTVDNLYGMSLEGAEYIREKVVQFGKKQAMKDALFKCVDILKNDEEDVDKCRDLVTQAVMTGSGLQDLGMDVRKNMHSVPDLIAAENAQFVRIPTGFPSLDNYLRGGPCRKHCFIIAGESGGGKSFFLLNVAANAVTQGVPVVYFTLGDLQRSDILLRYASRRTLVPSYEISAGSEKYYQALLDDQVNDWTFRVEYYPSKRATVDTLRAFLMQLKIVEGISPGLVAVDYMDEILSSRKDDDDYKGGGEIATGLMQMGVDFNALIWTASQVNRWEPTFPGDVIRGNNIADSSRKRWKADGLITLTQTPEEYDRGEARLWIDKVRRGVKNMLIPIKVDFDRAYMRQDPTREAGTLTQFCGSKQKEVRS